MGNVTYRSNVGLKSRFPQIYRFISEMIQDGMRIEQELSYRKQIARQLRTQYAEGMMASIGINITP